MVVVTGSVVREGAIEQDCVDVGIDTVGRLDAERSVGREVGREELVGGEISIGVGDEDTKLEVG